MKPVMQNRNQQKNVFYLLSILFILGILTSVLSLICTEGFLQLFSSDGKIDPMNLSRITVIRKVFWITGASVVVFSSIGMLIARRFHFILNDRLLNWILLAIVFIWGIFLVEMFLRTNPLFSTIEIQKYSPPYQPSAFSQHQFEPSTFYLMSARTKDTIRILSNGFSRKEFHPHKEEGVIRIFVVGGSHVYDPNSQEIQGDWVNQIEAILRDKGISNIEVINAGVPGWRTFDSIGRLLSELHYYEPDYIVLCHSYNDLKYFGWVSPNETPFYNIPALVKKTHAPVGPGKKAIENLQIYLRLKNLLNKYKSKVMAKDLDYILGRDTIYSSISPWAIRQFEINIKSFVAISRAIGVKPILTTQPRHIDESTLSYYVDHQKRGDKLTSTKLDAPTLLAAYTQCDSLIKAIAKESEVPVIDLSAHCSGNRSKFSDIIHYQNGGGKCASEMMADFFSKYVVSSTQ